MKGSFESPSPQFLETLDPVAGVVSQSFSKSGTMHGF